MDNTMKLYNLLYIALTLLVTGCAGLNVSGAATITYNTPAVTVVTMTPGAAEEVLQKP